MRMRTGGGKGAEDPATLLRTSVGPDGRFRVARHQPSYRVANLRPHERVCELGRLADGRPVTNQQNFPEGVVDALEAESVFEIANPFPFRGTTYIGKTWADDKRRDPSAIRLPPRPAVSMRQWLREHCSAAVSTTTPPSDLLKTMPEPVQLALAVNSTDPEDLIPLAEAAGDFVYDSATGRPAGLCFAVRPDGSVRPRIHNRTLFEAVANNVYLPDDYKDAMVLRPGAQGGSAIVGEWRGENGSHVYEYLRRNSYIPWGHYAANMANDTVRYQPEALTMDDMTGMRHLYYQRTYVRLAEMMGLPLPPMRQSLKPRRRWSACAFKFWHAFTIPARPIKCPLTGGCGDGTWGSIMPPAGIACMPPISRFISSMPSSPAMRPLSKVRRTMERDRCRPMPAAI